MEVSYNLRYQKSNFSNRIILDKEGEVIIYAKGFRLKGKGATDKGELINFSEIKEFYYRNDKVIFVTFNKEKYVLFEAGTLFEQFLTDLYRARNEFLMDALFMKAGKLRSEFEGDFQKLSKFGKLICKGKTKVRLYDGSLVIVPVNQDAFSLHFDFVNFYEFDEDEYSLKIVMDDGSTLFFSKFGNDFEFFQEKLDSLLGGMYESIVNEVLREIFPEFHATVLLKLAYRMKGGKGVSLHDMKKIDKDLAVSFENFIFQDEAFREKSSVLKSMSDDFGIHYGIAKDHTVKGGFVKWAMFSVPEKNIVAFTILPRWEENGKPNPHDTYFYRIIMEKGNPADKLEDKVREIDQALVVLNFAKDPCYKDKKDLKHSPYQYAIRKLPFLRILRKSFVGRVSDPSVEEWQKKALSMIENAKVEMEGKNA